MNSLFIKQCRRELLIQKRQTRYLLNSCLFFLMLLFLFPLTVPPEVLLMKTIAPGLIWIALLLSMLLSSERLFQSDFDQGILEQWLLSGQSVPLIIGAKISTYWFYNIIPLLILSPLIALLFDFSLKETGILVISLLTATPALFALCALCAVFGISINQRGILMALILLPLSLPLLVFGSATLTQAIEGLPILGNLALLLALSVMALSLIPFAIAAIIKIIHAN